ncbi:MAG: UPF0175 family protein [Candidatus Hydrogenedentes bacterium]|nr:UPF0175 family protein [Candidatus Hydrogenedentota bacterium]
MSTLTIELPSDVRPDEATLMLAMKLWETGRLSLGQAAQLAGFSKRAFVELLGKHNIPLFDYPPGEFD